MSLSYRLFHGLAVGLALALPATAQAQVITGPARAVDGDSLEMTGTRIRLFGIDAPEALQTCRRGGEEWACGRDAAAIMADLVSGEQVSCQAKDTDAYGRIVAVCTASRLDLAKVMVDAGMAIALPDFTDAYVASETKARQQLAGLWGSTFTKPSDYRAAKPSEEPRQTVAEQGVAPRTLPRAQGSVAAQAGCTIKGNHSRRGEWIYHLPGMPYYDATRPEEVFCTEAQAQAAGYRRAIVR